MEKIALFFVENSSLIFAIIFIFGFVLPIILKSKRRSKVAKHGDVLTSRTILVESNYYLSMFFILVLLIFIFGGLLIIYLGITKSPNMTSVIMSFIFGGLLIVFPLSMMIKSIISCREILKGNYVIIEDVLKDKEQIRNLDLDTEGATRSDKYYLYFENYFKKYDKRVFTDADVYHNAKIGDKFYLVFTKKNCFAFNANSYKLETTDKIISIDELGNYIYLEKNTDKKDEIKNGKIIINKSKVKNDFKKSGHQYNAVFFVICCFALIISSILSIFVFKNLISIIISLISTFVFMYITFIKIKYIYTTYKNINSGLFEIKEDEIILLNRGVEFKDSNDVISFKFKDYKNIIYGYKKDYPDVKIGDKFYLIFINGEKEPIGVYNSNDSILEKN